MKKIPLFYGTVQSKNIGYVMIEDAEMESLLRSVMHNFKLEILVEHGLNREILSLTVIPKEIKKYER